jgi:hypothetical protein
MSHPNSKRTARFHARRGLTFDQKFELEFGPSHFIGSVFADDDERRAYWKQYRGSIMATWQHGMRPFGWWWYEPRAVHPGWGKPEQEATALFAAGQLVGDELALCEARWREAFDEAQTRANFLDGDRWVDGEAAKREFIADAGIPESYVRQWQAEQSKPPPAA